MNQESFVPRRDFHPKIAMMENAVTGQHGIVLGSGNLSYNGLQRSVEAGSAIIAANKAEYDEHIGPVRSVVEELWKCSNPLHEIEKIYEERLADLQSSRDLTRSINAMIPPKGFWIEAGYVTKNRGNNKPGNQIFAPNGFRRFFGLKKGKNKSTRIGEITFETEAGPVIKKNYRENDNGMEKLSLPNPEDHDFGVYDGKVLVFIPKGKRFFLSAIELSEFEIVYGHRLGNINRMVGGRRFGELA